MTTQQTSCKRCGKCCIEGGPALHGPDLDTVLAGKIPLKALITLRKGELALNPVSGLLVAIKLELVKLKGTGTQWSCTYFDSDKKCCSIYDYRPQACDVLQCWQPEALLAMVEKDTLTRLDIVLPDDPLRSEIMEHERLYPCPDMDALVAILPTITEIMKEELQGLVNDDLGFRVRVVKAFGLKLCDELFYFGRPIFQLLQPLGVRVTETAAGVKLHWH